MSRLVLPAKLIWSKEIEKYAEQNLGLTAMPSDNNPRFIFISEKGYYYINDNAVEFGVSNYTFIEQRDFLKLERDTKIIPGMLISLIPKDTSEIFSIVRVKRVTYNNIHDTDGHTWHKDNFIITILTKNDVKILKDMKVIK